MGFSGRATRGLLFGQAGRYSLRAVYVGRKHGRVKSNTLPFQVSEPIGAEAEVFAAVQESPDMLIGSGDRAKLRDLLEKHADSRYLRRARLELLEVKAYDIWNDADRRTNKPARYL